MAQISMSAAACLAFFIATMAVAFGQDIDLAPSPSPSMDKGSAVSLPFSGAFLGCSLVLSLLALMKH